MKPLSFGLAATIFLSIGMNEARSQAVADPAKKEAGAKSQLATADEKFAKTAGMDGLAEVKLGELAREKASAPDVKEFGEMMASDHGKANEELKELAVKKGVILPETLDRKQQQTAEKLGKLSGAAFDKAYSNEMVKAHKNAITLFEAQAKNGKDEELKAFAEKTLPTLKTHLEKAQGLQETAKKGEKK